MKLEEFRQKTTFTKVELLAHAYGTLVEDAPKDFCRLPTPPMLMLDRITSVTHVGARGSIVAERDVHIDDWFFGCHFLGDPVQPGCLGVDAVWQLVGFYLALRGPANSGRALGCKEIEFRGQIRPHSKLVRYEIEIRRYTELVEQGAVIAIGTGKVFVDDEHIYTINDAKVGGFKGIAYPDYPHLSANAVGGIMER